MKHKLLFAVSVLLVMLSESVLRQSTSQKLKQHFDSVIDHNDYGGWYEVLVQSKSHGACDRLGKEVVPLRYLKIMRYHTFYEAQDKGKISAS